MTTKTWKTWTVKEKAQVRDWRAQGWPAKRIAAALGRTEASVKCLIGAEGDMPLHRPRRLEWLYALTSGLTERKIAEKLEATKWAVKRMKQRLKGKL
jgi:DNA-binding NarL/FixJ family response regulator